MTRGRQLPAAGPRWAGAAGALVAQATLAGSSFVLQVLAARSLGAEGLGRFALLFGCIVMATAVSTGLVGDSLTVLDRSDPAVRSALVRTAAVVVVLATTAAVGVGAVVGLRPGTAAVFGAATATFLVADLVRRLLMAGLRFWRLVLLDLGGLAAAATVLGVAAWRGTPTLSHFLAALTAAQATVCLLGWGSLPGPARRWPARCPGAVHQVLGFGGWRAAQQFVRPTSLNLARWLVLLGAGQAAVGELEAARVFVAPAMLLVQGLASYLFASYAADRAVGAALLRRADRAATGLLAGSVAVVGVAVLLLPLAGPVLTAGRFPLEVVAVLGWGVYAASCAVVMPYGSLAAVRGRPAAVLAVRVLDSTAGLLLVTAAVLLAGASAGVVPWLLALGSFGGALACRRLAADQHPADPPRVPVRPAPVPAEGRPA